MSFMGSTLINKSFLGEVGYYSICVSHSLLPMVGIQRRAPSYSVLTLLSLAIGKSPGQQTTLFVMFNKQAETSMLPYPLILFRHDHRGRYKVDVYN
jgi:hypothetical protein